MLGPKTENDLKPSKGKVRKSIQSLFSILISMRYELCVWPVYMYIVYVVVTLLSQQNPHYILCHVSV